MYATNSSRAVLRGDPRRIAINDALYFTDEPKT